MKNRHFIKYKNHKNIKYIRILNNWDIYPIKLYKLKLEVMIFLHKFKPIIK